MELSAAIFDLDGTIISNEDEYGEAFKIILKRLGVDEKSEYPHLGGIGVAENWPIFIKKYSIKTSKSIEELATETQAEYIKLIPRVTLQEGFLELVEELRESHILLCLATSNTWAIVEKLYDHLGIESCFDSVTTGEEVLIKKPDPEIFLKAAEKIGVDPSECLVFEDSRAGVMAAKAAGMKVVGVVRDKEQKKFIIEADLLINNFDEVSQDDVAKL